MRASLNVQCLALAAALALPAPAAAHWEKTKWGMSPQQVKAAMGAAPGSGIPGDNMPGYTVGNVGTYAKGGFSFRAVYYHRSNALALVLLQLNSGDCAALRRSLVAAHGAPATAQTNAVFESAVWRDKLKNDQMTYRRIGTCSIRYQPLAAPAAAAS
ncbi:MAG TPA: hypothetical protein VE053_10880 [Allosphingosinicella sp.]|nr:hypothetical protein [Allosphingosinicella sp.]